MNIGTQAIFPLAVAFTPTISGAESNNHFLQNRVQTALQTRVYTIGEGETGVSVAKKYNMSQDALRKLNQFRTFARGFDHLQPGDELDVPVTPLPEVRWYDATAVSVTEEQDNDAQAQKVAGYASQAGSFLANGTSGDAAASIAQGMVSGAASGEIQQWLSRFGTARVQLDADKNFSLKNSQLDLLVPLYEQKDSLVFTQGSIHRTDDRTQSNLGLGYRWFSGDWMLGVNTFLDYDLSREHARLGLGGEYWRDFLKVSVNSYHRLTNWKNSPDQKDYEERPANGWDIRTQAWVPSLPQLGGKLMYEQYYGDEVALFGRDSRQKNPHAITAGVNYTPFPLLTFGLEQRQGQSGKSDSRFIVDMNYQLGVPWQQQINPDAVATMRSLVGAGSRYDLVERNNNIVLEYRKKDVIHLKTADLVTGYAGEKKSLGVSVTSKYGLERIDWSASSLIAAGGKIVQNSGDWTVVMPAYRSGTESINNYTVTGVAVDKKGNVSNRTDTQITVTQAAIDTDSSSLSPLSITLPADGSSQQQFVLKVNDKEGRPVDIAANEISIEKKNRVRGSSNATLSAFTRRAAGEYLMTVTAGTMPESFTLIPSARNTHFASAHVTLSADSATALVDALNIIENDAIADGKSPNKFRITVVDAQNNRVPGQAVSLKANNGAAVAESAITEDDGTVVVPVTSVHAGQTIVTGSISNRGGKTLELTFRPDQNTARIKPKDFNVLPEVSLADGKTKKTITAKITDAKGNAIPDMPVTFNADNGAAISENKLTSDTEGHVTTTLTSTVSGISRVTATVNNLSTTKDTTFTGNSATAIVASVDTKTVSGIADGVTSVTFKAQIKDQNGNPLPGVPVDWKSDKDSSIVSFNYTQTSTSEQGIAEAAITSTRAYSDVVITASTNASSKSASPFTFVADKQNPVITALSSDKKMLTANGIEAAILSVSVADKNGNPLSGVEVTLSNSDNTVIITPSRPVTGADGVASAVLTTRHAGEMNISASLNQGEKKTLSLQAIADEQTAAVTVTADMVSATAGQAQPVTLTATVVDVNDNPVSGTSVGWTASYNQLSKTISQTNAEGKATIQLTGTQAILTTVTAELYNGRKGSAQVTFGPGEPAAEHSQIYLSPQSITADGKSEALASLVLRDNWDNPVPGKTVSWNADAKAGIRFAPSEKGDGLYQASVTGTSEGVWSLSAQSGAVSMEIPLALLASQGSAQIDSVKVSGFDTAKADGQETVTIRTQVKDKNGNTKLKGVPVGWITSLGTLPSRPSSTDENGVAEITLRSRTAGIAQVSAILGGGEPFNADRLVSFTAGDISADKSSISISSASIVAGKESATLSVIVRDAEGNPLTALKDNVRADFSPQLDISVSAFNEVSSGVYETVVSGKKAGMTQVTATVSGTRINRTTALTIRADNDSAIVKGNISVNPDSATVGSTVIYSAELSDANGNTLGAGIPVIWNENEGSTLNSRVTHTGDLGTTSVKLTRQQEGTAKVNLTLPSGITAAPDVIFNAGDVDENRSELTLSPSVIVAGKDAATLTLTLRDSHGNLLRGKTVRGISNNSNVHVGEAQQNSNAPGQYTMAVSSNRVGSVALSIQVDDKTLNKSRTLTVKGDVDSWKLSSFTQDKTNLTAGDTKGVTYKATVTDAHGNLLSNVVVSWHLSGKAESYEETSRTNEKGVATTTVISNTAGLLKMTARLDTDNHIQANDVTVVAANIKHATFDADKTSIGSDGKDSVTLTASLKDSYGNPVIGKTVTIQGTESLAGFKLSAVKDQQDGSYVATGTATNKGQVILSAQVNGKKMGNSVTVKIGAITPDLRFDNKQQEVTWTKNFTASQSVQGMPEGLKQSWTSSDPAVVTVSDTGKATLNKSGEARITVFTPGNAQYNSAMATYTLKVNKARPQLIFGSGDHSAVYGSKFLLPAVKSADDKIDLNDLVIDYISSSPEVSDIDESGIITMKKAGSVKFYAKTTENNRFEASEAEYVLVIAKAKLRVSFNETLKKVNTQQMSTNKKAYWQDPVQTFPKDANLEITSSDSSVLKVDTDGTVKRYSPGTTRIKISVKEDDRYESSMGDYDLNIYGRPVMSVTSIQGTSQGTLSDVTNRDWQPYFINDELQIDWFSKSDTYYLPEKVTVRISVGDAIIIDKQYGKGETSSGKTKIKAQSSWVGKIITVSVTGYGFADIESEKVNRIVQTSVIDINKVFSSATAILKHNIFLNSDGSKDSTNTCRASYMYTQRDAYLDFDVTIKPRYTAEKTLFLHDIRLYIHGYTRKNDGKMEDFKRSISHVKNSEYLYFAQSNHGRDSDTLLVEDCWKNHSGGMDDQGAVTAIVTVEYAGKKYTMKSSEMKWSADSGNSNQPDINLTVQ